MLINQVLLEKGQGFGILVSKVAKETNATYTLQEPSEVSTMRMYPFVPMFFLFFVIIIVKLN